MSNDSITLSNLEFYSYHGYLKEERKLGNIYLVNIRLFTCLNEAGRSDDLKKTINYTRIYQLIEIEVKKKSNLLENIAYRIIKRIFKKFKAIIEIEIKVTKKSPPIGGICEGVIIEMRKKQSDI